MSAPTRRQVLRASGGLLAGTLLAGCTGTSLPFMDNEGAAPVPTAELRMTEVSDVDIARNSVYRISDPNTQQLMSEITASGSATANAPKPPEFNPRPPLPEDTRIFYEDSVYQFSYEVTNRQPLRHFHVSFDTFDEETPSDDENIQYENLPEVDREKFSKGEDINPTGGSTTLSYTPSGIEQSLLVPSPRYSVIVWPKGAARLSIEGTESTTKKTYRYTVTETESAEKYGQQLRERYVSTLSPASTEQRDILQEAINSESGYIIEADTDPSSAFRSLVDRFRTAESVPPPALNADNESQTDVSGQYITRYDGQVYMTNLILHNNQYSETTQA